MWTVSVVEFFMWLSARKRLAWALGTLFILYQIGVICVTSLTFSIFYAIAVISGLIAMALLLSMTDSRLIDKSKVVELPQWSELADTSEEPSLSKDFRDLAMQATPLGQRIFEFGHYYFKFRAIPLISILIILNLWAVPLLIVGLYWPVRSHVQLDSEIEGMSGHEDSL